MQNPVVQLQQLITACLASLKAGLRKMCSDPNGIIQVRPTDEKLPTLPNDTSYSAVLALTAFGFYYDPILMVHIEFDDDEFMVVPDQYTTPDKIQESEFFKSVKETVAINHYNVGIQSWSTYKESYLPDGLNGFEIAEFGIQHFSHFKLKFYWRKDSEDIVFSKSGLLFADKYTSSLADTDSINKSLMGLTNVPYAASDSQFDASLILAAKLDDLTLFKEKLEQKSVDQMQNQFGGFKKKAKPEQTQLLENHDYNIYKLQESLDIGFYAEQAESYAYGAMEGMIAKSLLQSEACDIPQLNLGGKPFHEESQVIDSERFNTDFSRFDSLKSSTLLTATPEEALELEELDIKEYEEDIILGKEVDWNPETFSFCFKIVPAYDGKTLIQQLL